MAHHSGKTAPGYRGWLVVLLRIVAPVPVLFFLGAAVWSVVNRGEGWVTSLIVCVVAGLSYVPFALSAYAGRYDPAESVSSEDEPD